MYLTDRFADQDSEEYDDSYSPYISHEGTCSKCNMVSNISEIQVSFQRRSHRWIDQYMTRCMIRRSVPVALRTFLVPAAGHIGWSDRQRLHVLLRVVEGHAAAGLHVTPIVDKAGAGLEAAEQGRVGDTWELPAIHNDVGDAALVVQAAIEHGHWKIAELHLDRLVLGSWLFLIGQACSEEF